MNGKINSIQSLGTLDGPGVRFVLFMQGCPLRCACCHNPETWSFEGGEEMTVETVLQKILACRNYFGTDGGVTVSGGEPLAQAEFVYELFSKCRQHGISTALDTSGCYMNEAVKRVISVTDTVLLDYKMTNDADYKKYVGWDIKSVHRFLEYLDAEGKCVWLRHVVIPGITSSDEDAMFIKGLKDKYSCIKKVELLPFHKLCDAKYENMNITFPLADTPEPEPERIDEMYRIIG